MRWIAFAPLLVSTLAHAATLDDLCPGANARIDAVGFPDGVPLTLESGSATVEFTVGAEPRASDLAVVSATDPAFESPAKTLVSSFTCAAQPAPVRVKLPIEFKRTFIFVKDACSNFQWVTRVIGYPRAAANKGLDHGYVEIEFKLMPDGQINEFHVLRSTDATFTKSAVYALSWLKCTGLGREVRVRVPFEYRLE